GPAKSQSGLTYVEQHRLKTLPDEIAKLEDEINKLENFLADPKLFSRDPVKFTKASEGLVQRQNQLAKAEEDWLELEDRAAR
ncbi:MAG TPA: elongation factor 3, partial [Rhodobacteraceae bacterium]|nr:elongation factor 3 [Paracoccaceae bacterium]